MLAKIQLLIDYTQVLVYAKSHPSPGLVWTDDDVSQGFAWNEGIASFGVPDHDGECVLEIAIRHYIEPDEKSLWAVQVPFDVHEPLMIGSVFFSEEVKVPLGKYNLIFEARAGVDDIAFFLNLTFSEADTPSFSVLKRGGDITASHVLKERAKLVSE